MKMRAFLWILEGLCLAAIFSTSELLAKLLVPLAFEFLILALVLRFLQNRFPKAWQLETLFVIGIGVLSLVGFSAARSMNLHPLIFTAHLVPALLLLLWFRISSERTDNLRLGITFVGSIVAASLSPDLITALFVFSVVIGTTLYLGLRFNQQVTSTADAKVFRRSIPTFWAGTLISSIVVGILIFPWIPRPYRVWSYWNLGSSTGFSGELNLDSAGDASSAQSSRVALKISVPKGFNLPQALPSSRQLVRGRSLKLFDGKSWLKKSLQMPSREIINIASGQQPANASELIEVQRSPLSYGAIPVFEGAELTAVSLPNDRSASVPLSFDNNEYFIQRSQRYPMRYWLNMNQTPAASSVTAPIPSHLQLPQIWKQDVQVHTFISKNFNWSKRPHDAEIVSAVEKFFGASRDYAYQNAADQKWKSKGFALFKEFLLETKRAHCELYASAAALILRDLGIPTRLVTGFQISPAPISRETWLATDQDAHAWVEAWDSEHHQWLTIDPTPPTPNAPLRHMYDRLNLTLSEIESRFALIWSDQVIAYTEKRAGDGLNTNVSLTTSQKGKSFLALETLDGVFRFLGNHSKAFMSALVFLGFGYFLRNGFPKFEFRRNRWNRQQKRYLQLERLHQKSFNQRDLEQFSIDPRFRSLADWIVTYERFRFNPRIPASDRKELKKSLNQNWRKAKLNAKSLDHGRALIENPPSH